MSRISPRPDAPLICEFSEAGERDPRALVTRGPLFFPPQSRDSSVGGTTWSLQVLVSEKGSAAFKLPRGTVEIEAEGNAGSLQTWLEWEDWI